MALKWQKNLRVHFGRRFLKRSRGKILEEKRKKENVANYLHHYARFFGQCKFRFFKDLKITLDLTLLMFLSINQICPSLLICNQSFVNNNNLSNRRHQIFEGILLWQISEKTKLAQNTNKLPDKKIPDKLNELVSLHRQSNLQNREIKCH